MQPLTDKQARLYNFIKENTKLQSPTIASMMKAIEVNNRGTITNYLRVLKNKGWLDENNLPRS